MRRRAESQDLRRVADELELWSSQNETNSKKESPKSNEMLFITSNLSVEQVLVAVGRQQNLLLIMEIRRVRCNGFLRDHFANSGQPMKPVEDCFSSQCLKFKVIDAPNCTIDPASFFTCIDQREITRSLHHTSE
jgi:hypothetical protein